MIVGLRVLKTMIAIAISISIARLLHLKPDHFAGIISMLAVQPSVFRSLHHSLSHIASALLASLAGIAAVYLFGNGAVVIAVLSFLVMAVHVKFRHTASLTLAVIVAINTMGTSSELAGGSAAYNQLMLVLIGMTVGTAVNAIRKPMHREREEALLNKSEGMLRALLYYIRIDVSLGKITPYKPDMRSQIEEVRDYIEKGKGVSQLIREDRWLNRGTTGEGDLFRTYETMVERIRDISKALQKADLTHPEAERLARAIDLVIRGQERVVVERKHVPFRLLQRSLHPMLKGIKPESDDIARLFPYYQAYEALSDYVRELTALQKKQSRAVTATVFRKRGLSLFRRISS